MAQVTLKHQDEEFNQVETTVEITFISHRMINEYGEIAGKIAQLGALHTLVVENKERRIAIKAEGDKEALAEYDKKYAEVKRLYLDLCSQETLTQRYDLVIDVLKRNQVTDKKLLSTEFYDEYVDPKELNEFMTNLVTRDKKKV